MDRSCFDIRDEPRGAFLRGLIRALATHSSSATVVIRDDLDLSEAGAALLERLRPCLIERKRSSSWPGTTLIGHEATVVQFNLGQGALDEILRAAEGLFDWTQPSLPEDLALLRQDGTAILATIAHERDAYLVLAEDEYVALVIAVPDIEAHVRRRAE